MGRLAAFLEKNVPQYSRPKKKLEQYRTQPEIAIETLQSLPLGECRVVVDLGSGTGMLSYTAYTLGAPMVVGVELDYEAVEDAKKTPLWGKAPAVDFVVADATTPPLRAGRGYCVAENPPFGISSRRGADLAFLCAAASLEPIAIASIHSYNEESIRLIGEKCRGRGYCVVGVKRRRFPIPPIYQDHWKRIHYVDIAIIVFERCKPWPVTAGETG